MNYESHCRVLIAEITAIAAAVAPHVSEYIGFTPHADENISLTDSVSVLGRDACNEQSVLDEVHAHTFTKTRYRHEVTSGADGGVRIKVQSHALIIFICSPLGRMRRRSELRQRLCRSTRLLQLTSARRRC